jgi:hypothetical protein
VNACYVQRICRRAIGASGVYKGGDGEHSPSQDYCSVVLFLPLTIKLRRLTSRVPPPGAIPFLSKRVWTNHDADICEQRLFAAGHIYQKQKNQRKLKGKTFFCKQRKREKKPKMSTTCLTIHDLLRITYTYEAQALQAQAQARKRSDSACFVSLITRYFPQEIIANLPRL